MKRPYQKGDVVFVGELPAHMSHFTYQKQYVVILYSYHDHYGGTNKDKYNYAVMGDDGGSSAWYHHDLLTLIEDNHALSETEWKRQQVKKLVELNNRR